MRSSFGGLRCGAPQFACLSGVGPPVSHSEELRDHAPLTATRYGQKVRTYGGGGKGPPLRRRSWHKAPPTIGLNRRATLRHASIPYALPRYGAARARAERIAFV